MSNWSDRVEEQNAKVQSEIENSKSLGAKCDKWDEASKILDFTAGLISLISPAPVGMLLKSGGAAVGSALGANSSMQSLIKLSASVTALAVNVSAWAATAFSAIANISQQYVTQDFDQYCVKFEGSFKARMHGEVAKISSDTLNEQNWWKFETIVSGTLTLRYPKPNQSDDGTGTAQGGWFSNLMRKITGKPQTAHTGQVVHLSGEFEGNATNFQVWRTPCLGRSQVLRLALCNLVSLGPHAVCVA